MNGTITLSSFHQTKTSNFKATARMKASNNFITSYWKLLFAFVGVFTNKHLQLQANEKLLVKRRNNGSGDRNIFKG